MTILGEFDMGIIEETKKSLFTVMIVPWKCFGIRQRMAFYVCEDIAFDMTEEQEMYACGYGDPHYPVPARVYPTVLLVEWALRGNYSG